MGPQKFEFRLSNFEFSEGAYAGLRGPAGDVFRPSDGPMLTKPMVGKECAMRAKRLTLQQRREIFHALVTTQDMVPNVPRW